MKNRIIFYCNNLTANIGIPGVNQTLIADLGKHLGDEFAILGSDYENYYKYSWGERGKKIKSETINKVEVGSPTIVIFTGFDPIQKMLPLMLRWRRKGAKLVFWNWGYLTKQQSNCNWSSGKVPLWMKRSSISITKAILTKFIDYYIVSGAAEQEDSNLDSNKCLLMPMGRPQSAILDECDSSRLEPVEYLNESLIYIGRGNWETKGVGNIVDYAASEHGKNWLYRFFISSKQEGFEDLVKEHSAKNLEWYYDVFGKHNLPWLQKSAAFITINVNPIQLRTPYESLYAGTPVVMFREAYMDGFKSILDRHNLTHAVQIITAEEFKTMSFNVATMNAEDRAKLAEIMHVVIDAKEFADWFGSWLRKPFKSGNYFEHVHAKLLTNQ